LSSRATTSPAARDVAPREEEPVIRSPVAATASRPPTAHAYVDLDSTVACPGCGLAAPWGALARIDVLEGAALESHLAVPPDGWFVDVRGCSRCGRSLARKVRARETPGEGTGHPR
jgi:hypothetical protein